MLCLYLTFRAKHVFKNSIFLYFVFLIVENKKIRNIENFHRGTLILYGFQFLYLPRIAINFKATYKNHKGDHVIGSLT